MSIDKSMIIMGTILIGSGIVVWGLLTWVK